MLKHRIVHPGTTSRAFTIVELLVVVSIIALLVGILLPAIGKARDQAKLTISRANLRQLGQAHATYATEWNDRQLTIANDNLGRYGNSAMTALAGYNFSTGSEHPGLLVGWGPSGIAWGYWFWNPGDGRLLQPIDFNSGWGWFRMPNVKAFTTYLNGRYYDPVFYAPKDRVAMSLLDECMAQPFEFVDCFTDSTEVNFVISSYCLSPAALYSPDVMSEDGFQDPFSLDAGIRCPSMSMASYSDLKTQFIEHHWLQNTHADCNANFAPGNFAGCEPYYFNHGRESVPMSLFYDGHVEGLGTLEADAASARAASQSSSGMGLWNDTTPFGTDGYFISDGWDASTNTSFHVLTTNGIRGRDKLGG
ncbi:MAG: type II secretion system protein [Planctomycetota bacterium]|jgi:prepilin-type N-terminal cleavage/methylation domain-containing protein